MTEDLEDAPAVEIVVNAQAVWLAVDGRPVLGMLPEVALAIIPRLKEAVALWEKHYRAFVLPGKDTVN